MILIAISGPTASGKTTLAIHLAKKLGAEIISCDSRQFYKELTIGTAKPTLDEREGVKHHFIDNKSIFDDYSAGAFEKEALKVISNLHTKKITPILVGGSGLYEKAILEGLDDFPTISRNTKSQVNQLYKIHGLYGLQKELKIKDPDHYKKVDTKNPIRLMRALEVCLENQSTYSGFLKAKNKPRPFSVLKIAIEWDRKLLYERINKRADDMMEKGLLEEAKNLYPHKNLNSLQTVGYKEIFEYLDGNSTLEESVEEIKKNTRRYAKRQLTWFRKEPSIHWFLPNDLEKVENFLKENKIEFRS